MSVKHTAGPWHWFERENGHVYLGTPDRGRLYVMDFGRRGMQGATPRFSVWKGDDRARQGGIMHDFVDAGGPLHPDARLIAAAPDLLEIVRTFDAYMGLAGEDAEQGSLNPIRDLRWKAQQALAKATSEGEP